MPNEPTNFEIKTIHEPISDVQSVIKLSFNDPYSIKFLTHCFEKNIATNTCGEMASFEDYPFFCSSIASNGSFLLMFEVNSKWVFLFPIDKSEKNSDINPSNQDSLTKLIQVKLKKCKKNTKKPLNVSVLMVNGEKNYNEQSLIKKLEELGIKNYSQTEFSSVENKNIGISVYFSTDKSLPIKVKLFPFSANLIYFPTYPKISGPKENSQQKNPLQENTTEFSVKLDGSNISLQYHKDNYLNTITRYHTINPKSGRSTQIETKWQEFLQDNQQKIFSEIYTKIKESYSEKDYDRILMGGEFCSNVKNEFNGFFIHTLRGIKGEKIEFLDNQKIHECCLKSHEDLFSKAEANVVQIYFMRQWFSKIGSLPTTKKEREALLNEMMSSLYGQDFVTQIQSGKIAANSIPEGVVGVEKNGSNTPFIKIKFDQFKDLDITKLKELENSKKCKQAHISSDEVTKYSEAILTESRLTKIKQYALSENLGMTNTISWAIKDIIEELKQEECFNEKKFKKIQGLLVKKITEYLNKPSTSQPISSNAVFFTLKQQTGTLPSSSLDQKGVVSLTKC